jgi:hypothetical protein
MFTLLGGGQDKRLHHSLAPVLPRLFTDGTLKTERSLPPNPPPESAPKRLPDAPAVARPGCSYLQRSD